jgi:lactate dehydrogenase-like 2-hydroxyacid dehydrogenase
MSHPTIFTTNRSPFHQKRALDATPPELNITMLGQSSEADVITHLAQAEYLISERSGVIDAKVLQAAPNLKLILRLGSMTHDIDLDAARKQGVMVCTWPDAGAVAVAEHTVMQILALLRKLREAQVVALEASPRWGESRRTDENTFSYNWSGRQQIQTLHGQTVGILGFGEIGAELARHLQGWGCTLLYNKRSRLPEQVEAERGLTYADMDRLRTESDVLVNLLPYSLNTVSLINAGWLAGMKSGAMIASCGSGGTIDEQALADAIRSGQIAGAALDSFSEEPLKADNPLVRLAREGANVLLTPHTASGNGRSRTPEYTNILRHLHGEPILNRLV